MINFKFKQAVDSELEILPYNEGLNPVNTPSEYTLGYLKSRHIVKNIMLLATRTYVPDYRHDSRFYCFYELWLDYMIEQKYGKYDKTAPKDIKLLRTVYKDEVSVLYPSDSIQYQQIVAKQVSEFCNYLLGQYLKLEESIADLDSDVYSNEFNYNGSNDRFIFTSTNKYTDILPLRYREVKKWQRIVNGLRPNIMQSFRNPFITELVEPLMLIDPHTQVTFSGNLKTGVIEFLNTIKKNEELVKENVMVNPDFHTGTPVLIQHYKYRNIRIQCQEDVEDIIQYYTILIKFHNLHHNQHNPQKSTLMLLMGSKDKGSIQILANTAKTRSDRFMKEYDKLKLVSNESDKDKKTLSILKMFAERDESLSNGLYQTVNFLSATPEEYLINMNNRNSVGAITALQAYESGTWNNKTDEVQSNVLRVQFDVNKDELES